MRPLALASILEIVSVSADRPLSLFRLEQLVGDAIALGVGDGFVAAVERQAHLALHVAGSRPAHQRVDTAGFLGFEFEDPFLGVGLARLHGIAGGFVDACKHGCRP